MKILTILGTRPSFIKAAPLSAKIAQTNGVEEIIVHTGQHYSANMDEVFFKELGIPAPGHRFEINNLGHGPMVGRMLEALAGVIDTERPDWVLVFGDTNSTLAGALAARLARVPLAHVEAGLRSYDDSMPEEVNRKMTDQMSQALFCPTKKAMENLKAEGFHLLDKEIVMSGDIMLDAARMFTPKAKRPQGLESVADEFAVATIHRAENTDDSARLLDIFSALETIAGKRDLVLPLHPRTRGKLQQAGYDFNASPVTFIEPVGYLEMIWLLNNASILLTDGGGLQKEAFFFKTPCVTIRDTSEWTELFDAGVNALAGFTSEGILESYDRMQSQSPNFGIDLYGDGTTCQNILDTLNK